MTLRMPLKSGLAIPPGLLLDPAYTLSRHFKIVASFDTVVVVTCVTERHNDEHS